MVRSILAVILGIVIGGALVAIFETIGHAIVPPPEGMDPMDPDSIKAHLSEITAGARLLVVIAWALASFGAGFLTAYVARKGPMVCALIVGSVLMLGGITNLIIIPSPAWMWILGLLAFLPMAWIGANLALGKKTPAAPAAAA